MLVSKTRRKTERKLRYKGNSSEWVSSFACDHLKILIVCRGPIRKEAMDVCAELGARCGILLSDKDSVTYPHTLAPELRLIADKDAIHRVPDYTGATSEERKQRIAQIIGIAQQFGYTHIFAGYGFMAEDAEFAEAIEKGGIGFVGPASTVHRAAGSKDEAKKLARRLGVSVTPGLDNITAVTLLAKAGGIDGLRKLAAEKKLAVSPEPSEPEDYAEALLQKGYASGVPLITLAELQAQTKVEVEKILKANPNKRLRFKYIGGGGGKGQRIITAVSQSDNAVVEVLSESKAMGEADNKNFLIELNIENTRHNEIQLIGNGEWCLALGGRDCSLQMHEQKLVELSITEELFQIEIERERAAGRESFAKTLGKDRQSLAKMEQQAELFGEGVSLNSASTFECIVSDDSFYFMEMNTRIQVEHRVTEMAYRLRFNNPANASESFEVESLVEAMILVAAHGKRLPKPTRLPRHVAGGEVRLNATNDALQPHAGGLIEFWSTPIEGEVRDDQGIGIRNPDTGWFMKYHLAGAYDSNIALLVTHGNSRRDLLVRLADILRRTELRGQDLSTNRNFHYGMVQFCLGLHPMLKPDTRFVVPYLAAVGSLAKEIDSFDLETAYVDLQRKLSALGKDAPATLAEKLTLVTRPLELMLANPHLLMGWLIGNRDRAFVWQNNRVVWKRNPLRALADLYRYLNLEERPSAAPAQQIWEHDRDLLERGLQFYADLDSAIGVDTEAAYVEAVAAAQVNQSNAYVELDQSLSSGALPKSVTQKDLPVADIAAAHRGWQTGLRLMDLLVLLGEQAGIFGFSVNEQLKPQVPARFEEAQNQKEYLRALEPPPAAAADEIVAVTGGMFYSRETPASPMYLTKGQHFSVGDPIYIIEVMKMFNKVHAEFAGTVEEVLLDGDRGTVVKKGQPLFKVKPDEELKFESADERAQRRAKRTMALIGQLG